MTPTEIVQKLLLNATNLDIVRELVAEDATYVSLNYDNPDLQAVRVDIDRKVDSLCQPNYLD